MSGGGETTTTSLPKWAVPYAQNFLQRSQQVANIPYTPYKGQTVAQFNPFQTQALNATAQRAIEGSPVNAAAQDEITKTLSGDYLSAGNPYLTGLIDKASGDVTRNYNNVIRPQQDSLMARSGSFGNAGVQSTINEQARGLGDTLANISTTLRGQDYSAERGRQLSALGLAPGIANQDYVDANALFGAGQAFQTQDQLNLSDQYRRFQEARDYPKEQLKTLGQGLGINYGSSTTGPGADPFSQAAGAAILGRSLFGSTSTGGGK